VAGTINILVGTMTGTAEIVAEDIQEALGDEGWTVELILMDDLEEDVFDRSGVFLICSSTYGQGDVPDNAMGFYEKLKKNRPNLGHVRYGVIALGDSTYHDTFSFGGKRFDELLTELGARRIGDACVHDASSDEVAEEKGVAWAKAWAGRLDEDKADAAD
jgi:MioC protein